MDGSLPHLSTIDIKQMIDLDAANKLVYPDYFQPRQWDVLRLRLLGYSTRQIGSQLGISERAARDRVNEVRWIIGLPFHQAGKGKGLMDWAIERID